MAPQLLQPLLMLPPLGPGAHGAGSPCTDWQSPAHGASPSEGAGGSRTCGCLHEYFRNWVEQDTDKARFMKRITAKLQQKYGFVSYDSYAMAAAIDESIVTEYLECAVSVELHGRYARGMLVLDTEDKWNKHQKVVLMKRCDLQKFKERLWAALQ